MVKIFSRTFFREADAVDGVLKKFFTKEAESLRVIGNKEFVEGAPGAFIEEIFFFESFFHLCGCLDSRIDEKRLFPELFLNLGR